MCSGLGVVGGAFVTPEALREMIHEMKALLRPPGLPFGVDLLLPKVGKGARATNYDYTHGALEQLINVVVRDPPANNTPSLRHRCQHRQKRCGCGASVCAPQ